MTATPLEVDESQPVQFDEGVSSADMKAAEDNYAKMSPANRDYVNEVARNADALIASLNPGTAARGGEKSFDPIKHPRDERGEFIKIGSLVQVGSSAGSHTIGSVIAHNDDGTIEVAKPNGEVIHRLPAKSVSVIKEVDAPKLPEVPPAHVDKNGGLFHMGSHVTVSTGSRTYLTGVIDGINADGSVSVTDPQTHQSSATTAIKYVAIVKNPDGPKWFPATGDHVKLPDGTTGTISLASHTVSGSYIVKHGDTSQVVSREDMVHVDNHGAWPIGDVIADVGEKAPDAPPPKVYHKPRIPGKSTMKPQQKFPDPSTLPEWVPKKGDHVVGLYGDGTIAQDKPITTRGKIPMQKYLINYSENNPRGLSGPEDPSNLIHVDADGKPVGDAIKGVTPNPFVMFKGGSDNNSDHDNDPDSHGFDGRFKPGKLDPEAAKAISDQMRIEFTEVPELRNTVTEISVIASPKANYLTDSCMGATMASSIHLYADTINRDMNDSDVASRQWMSTKATDGPDLARHVVVHEMGHSVSARMDTEGKKEIQAVLAEATDTPLEDINKVDKVELASMLSNYGASSPKEMMAECWAEYRLSKKPRPLAMKVGKIMQQHMTDMPARPADNIRWMGAGS